MDRELWWMDALNDSLVLSLWGRVTIFGQYRGMLLSRVLREKTWRQWFPRCLIARGWLPPRGRPAWAEGTFVECLSWCNDFFIGVESIVYLLFDA